MIDFALSKLPKVALTILLGLVFTGQAYADGSAVFASVTTSQEESRLTKELEARLDTTITTSSVWVEAVNWTRLQSAVMPESEARALVARARSKGYSAWYNSSGNRWASSADQAPAASQRSFARDTSVKHYNDINTSAEDLSHLPMAETFPID